MKLSVIVPVYNVAPYLRACLDSLVAASEKVISAEVEIICVDDGSTDGSAEILDEFQSELEKKGGVGQWTSASSCSWPIG